VAAKVCFSSKHGLNTNQCPRVPGHDVSHAMVELPPVPDSYSGSLVDMSLALISRSLPCQRVSDICCVVRPLYVRLGQADAPDRHVPYALVMKSANT
jgi:hypothetical protein